MTTTHSDGSYHYIPEASDLRDSTPSHRYRIGCETCCCCCYTTTTTDETTTATKTTTLNRLSSVETKRLSVRSPPQGAAAQHGIHRDAQDLCGSVRFLGSGGVCPSLCMSVCLYASNVCPSNRPSVSPAHFCCHPVRPKLIIVSERDETRWNPSLTL
jgi:hypothetical protein